MRTLEAELLYSVLGAQGLDGHVRTEQTRFGWVNMNWQIGQRR